MPPKLPLRLRVAGWLLSRAEFAHRGLRDVYRTPLGFLLVWTNVAFWSFLLLERFLPC
jgi:hypothetical protein